MDPDFSSTLPLPPLFSAIESNDCAEARKLLSSNPLLIRTTYKQREDWMEYTPLLYATSHCVNSSMEMLTILLEARKTQIQRERGEQCLLKCEEKKEDEQPVPPQNPSFFQRMTEGARSSIKGLPNEKYTIKYEEKELEKALFYICTLRSELICNETQSYYPTYYREKTSLLLKYGAEPLSTPGLDHCKKPIYEYVKDRPILKSIFDDAIADRTKLSFLMGMHDRLGADSSIHRALGKQATESPEALAENHLPELILSFIVGAPKTRIPEKIAQIE